MSLAARDTRTRAETPNAQEGRRNSAILFALMSDLLFLRCWLTGHCVWAAPKMCNCRQKKKEQETTCRDGQGSSFSPVPWGPEPRVLCLTLDGMVSYPRMPRWARVGTTEMPEYRWWNHSSEVTELVPGRCGVETLPQACPSGGPPAA